MAKELLTLKSLTYKLGKRTLLSRVNLTLPSSGLFTLTGENGAGKSSLAELIIGIKTPSSGKILFDKKDITSLSITERARLGLGYAFQTPVSLRGLKVKDLVQEASVLHLVGLPETYLDRELDSTLSGGEKKRIELASVLAKKPRLMILDEPEAGIDLWSLDNLIKLFKNLKASSTLLLITHQEKFINLADKKYILKNSSLCNL